MKTKTRAHRGRPDLARLIAEWVRRYEEVQKECYSEMVNQDLQKVGVLLPEMQLLRQRLASYGVRVSP